MNLYRVKYLQNGEKLTVLIRGEDEIQAGENFSAKYPNIKSNQIVSVTDSVKNTKYNISIIIANLVIFLGFAAVIIGIGITMILVKEGGSAILGMGSSLSLSAVGLVLIIAGHSAMALFDTANNSRAILDEIRYKGI